MSRRPAWVNRWGFRALAAPRVTRFAAALWAPERAQRHALRRCLAEVRGTRRAAALGLRGDEDPAAFARKVPVVDYDDLRSLIDEQVRTGTPALTRATPTLYEPTSGSSGRVKLVPYTPALLASFQSLFTIWAADLVAHGPRLQTGRMFFSTSPAFQTGRRTPTGVPISMEDDAAYLSARMQRLLAPAFFVPPDIKRIQDGVAFRRALLAVLLAEPRLEILSVWSPTYLLALLDTWRADGDLIREHLRRGWTGTEDLRVPLPPVDAARLARLDDPASAWPHLKLLSCWTDADSAAFVPALRRAFPGVHIQGKGLLATEAPLTVPLIGAPAPVPLVDEVYLEFETASGALLPLHRLREGDEGAVILTQAGGLLRYRMHDRVRVEGRVGRTPGLRFLGREGRSSDLVGEKLGEAHVRGALDEVLGPEGHCSWLVAEVPDSGPPGYRCVSDHPDAISDPEGLSRRLDEALGRAYHYGQARGLGQLQAVQVEARPDARDAYERLQLARGLRWGDIKFSTLVGASAQRRP